MAEVSRGHSTTAVEEGRAEHQGRQGTLSSLRDEHGRQTTPDRGTTGEAKQVKPAGLDQRAEPSPTQDKGKANAELWERIWERQNLSAALKRVERNGGAPGIDGMTVKELRPYLKKTLVGDQGSVRPADVSAKPGKAGRDTQDGWRDEAVRDTDSSGSLSPTSDSAGAHVSI